MNKCKMTPYEGTAPYIFISYAHKDSDRVYPILDEMADRGYRIWYDDGIAPGSEWPEYIAEHLNNSDVVIAFISANSIASSNCRREVTFALSKKKKFLAIVLEETEMSLGMEMQLSAQQSIFKHNYSTEEAFYNKLCDDPDLQVCQADILTETEAKADEGLITETLNAETELEKNAISSEDMKAVEQMHGFVAKLKKPKKSTEFTEHKTSKDNSSDKRSSGKVTQKLKKAALIALAAFASIILLIIVVAITKSAKAIKFDNGAKIDASASSLTVHDITVTEAQIKKICKMKNLQNLTLKNCVVEGDLSSFKNAEQFRSINLQGTPLNSYAFLSEMPNLNVINLSGGNLSDTEAAALKNMKSLRDLNLTGNINFTDVSLIPTATLTTLVLDGTGIKSIEALCNAEKLTALSFSYTAVNSINTEFKSLRLEKLEMMELSEVNDLSAFSNLTKLKVLKVAGCKASDFAWISQNKDTLTTLDISGLNISETTREAIGHCTSLQELYMNAVPTDNLSFIRNLKNLTVLYASHCGLTDVSALQNLSSLCTLWLNNNEIETISPKLTSLKEVNLAHNKITDLTTMSANWAATAAVICIYDNPISLSSLRGSSNNAVIIMSYDSNGILDKTMKSYGKLYIADIPANKLVELEDTYSSKLYSVTVEDLDRRIEESYSLYPSNWPKE